MSKTMRRNAYELMSDEELERAMWEAVERLDFERAATLRDLIAESRGETPEGTGRKGTPHPPARGRRRRR